MISIKSLSCVLKRVVSRLLRLPILTVKNEKKMTAWNKSRWKVYLEEHPNSSDYFSSNISPELTLNSP